MIESAFSSFFLCILFICVCVCVCVCVSMCACVRERGREDLDTGEHLFKSMVSFLCRYLYVRYNDHVFFEVRLNDHRQSFTNAFQFFLLRRSRNCEPKKKQKIRSVLCNNRLNCLTDEKMGHSQLIGVQIKLLISHGEIKLS
jgi:hypothetical protein